MSAFLYKNGAITRPCHGIARGINKKDVVVGSDEINGFMYERGRLTDIGILPGYSYDFVDAVNDRGQIAGASAPGTFRGARAFVYEPRKGLVNLGTLRATDSYSRALAINNCGNCGHVVGFSGSAEDIYSTSELSAFLYARGMMVDLNSRVYNRSAFTLNAASGINDHGQIVGRGSLNGQQRAFLLTPRYQH